MNGWFYVTIFALWGLACYLMGFMAGLPTRIRMKRIARLREEIKVKRAVQNLNKVQELSWAFIKEHAPYVYPYFYEGRHWANHRPSRRMRMKMWWQQTRPRYSHVPS